MRAFLNKIFLFVALLLSALVFSLLFLKDKSACDTILGAIRDKNESLKKMDGGKIIFLGGSNLSFGLNSKEVSEAFQRPVINMGVHAGVGLEYIVNSSKPFVKENDIVVLAPEYENFYSDNFYGEMELVSSVFDVHAEGKQYIGAKQWIFLLQYVPVYAAKKIRNIVGLSFSKADTSVNIYHRRSFNSYGDAFLHWSLPDQDFACARKLKGKEHTNPEVIGFVADLKKYVTERKAKLIILPPVMEQQSFLNMEEVIRKIESDLKSAEVAFVSDPAAYSYNRKYFFNSYYHTNKKGVDLRTAQVISDLKRILGNG
jgi:hypothetical protein